MSGMSNVTNVNFNKICNNNHFVGIWQSFLEKGGYAIEDLVMELWESPNLNGLWKKTKKGS